MARPSDDGSVPVGRRLMPAAVAPPIPEPTDGEPRSGGAVRGKEEPAAAIRVLVLERAADLVPHLPAWRALSLEAAEPNVFYEPCVLLPALSAFGGAADLALVLLFGDPPGPPRKNAPSQLWGFFPLVRLAASSEFPLPCFRLWHHEYSYVPVPLVHRAHGARVLAAFFDWLATQRRAPALLSINKLPVGGPFHQLLIDEMARRPMTSFVKSRETRALLAPDCDAETYQARALAGKHRKEARRQRKRLSEMGRLEFVELTAGDDLEVWIAAFLEVEGGGWKGREGTSLGSKQPDTVFFREMATACREAGKLAITAIRLDGRPVAMQVMLLSGRGAFAFKLGYDEAFARFSPGVLLELDLVERVAAGWAAAWIDSCAARDHPMINRLWTERRGLESLLLSADGRMDFLLSLMPAAVWLKRMITSLKGRRQS
jgi:Acetyltransferase (GNAT) domain